MGCECGPAGGCHIEDPDVFGREPPMIGQTISHYKILEKLGEGGMGVVYKAHDTKLDRFVALKFLPRHIAANDAEKARFLQEAKSAAALNHPNVCSVIDIQEDNGEQFIVMEYVDGMTLRTKLQGGPIPANEAMTYAIQIGDALQEAHSNGIVHRDVKADNVMLNSKKQIKVMDFGLAKLKGSLKLTRTSSTVGTVGYMAPEQIEGGDVDHRSDIFSFGVLLFELLTGKLPFRGEHEAALVYSIVNEEPTDITSLLPDLSPVVVNLIHRCLEKDPADRYQHMDDIVSELRRVQKKTGRISREHAIPPPEVRPTAPILPSKKASRQLVLSLATAAVILLVAVGYFLFRPAPAEDSRSVAVLPFKNMNSGEENEFFSDGVTEDIINQLSRIRSLRVMARPAVMRFKNSDKSLKDIGRELNVATLLTGTVRRSGDQIRISAQLIEAASERQLWGETYDQTMTKVFEIQTAVAEQIASALQTNLSAEEVRNVSKQQTGNVEAYTYYLKGREYYYRYHKEDNENAVKLFKKALDLDPKYALALAGLGDAYAQRVQKFGYPSAWLDSSVAVSLQSIALDPTLAEGYKAAALAYGTMGKIQLNLEYLQKSIAQNPNYYPAVANLGEGLRSTGKPDEALAWVKKAQAINPTAAVTSSLLGGTYYDLGDLVNARANIMHALELQPDLVDANGLLCFLDAVGGQSRLARERAERLVHSNPNESSVLTLAGDIALIDRAFNEAMGYYEKEISISGDESGNFLSLAYVYARLGRPKDAEVYTARGLRAAKKWLEKGDEGSGIRMTIALGYGMQGNKAEASKWFHEALDRGWIDYRAAAVWPPFDTFRNDEEFKSEMKKLESKVEQMRKRAEELD